MATKQTSGQDSPRSPNKLIMPFALATTAALGSIVLGHALDDHVDRTSPKPAVSSEPNAEGNAKDSGSAIEGTLGTDMLAPRADTNLAHKFELTPLQHNENSVTSVVNLDHSTATSVGQSGSHLPTSRL